KYRDGKSKSPPSRKERGKGGASGQLHYLFQRYAPTQKCTRLFSYSKSSAQLFGFASVGMPGKASLALFAKDGECSSPHSGMVPSGNLARVHDQVCRQRLKPTSLRGFRYG